MSNPSFGRGRRENSRSNNSLGDYFDIKDRLSARDLNHDDKGGEKRVGGRRESGGSRRGGGDRGFRRISSYNRQPREEGMIVSLLDSFGFIKCAERDEDIFFHFSEIQRNTHPSDLEIGMEVDFDIGASSHNGSSSKQEQKSAAFRVNVLPKGTVKWELPDEDEENVKRGKVEKASRMSHSRSADIRSSPYDGTIRLISNVEDDLEKLDEVHGPKFNTETILIAYSVDDYMPARNQPLRLLKGDLIEFNTVIERRSNKKLAKNIRLIQSENDRQRELREKKMLAEATLERGVVVSLSNDNGFLRSTSRREYIPFQYSNVELPESHNEENSSNDEYKLVVGQDMEFLVCKDDTSSRNNQANRLIAMKIKFLPKGTVEFYQSIAKGVSGILVTLPFLHNHNRNRGPQIHMKEKSFGKIRLKTPIALEEEETLSEILLDAENAPGGIYAANRDGSQLGLWIREGDTLLFDIIKETLDGSYHAKPTLCLIPMEGSSDTNSIFGEKEEIRLLRPSLAGRVQGVVSAVKDGYGFITCVERNVDVYFRFYELFPASIQSDIVRHQIEGVKNFQTQKKLTVGTLVTFDMSLSSSGPQEHNRGKGKHNNTENLKAQRVCLLPRKSFAIDVLIAEDVQAVVTQEHNDKSGFLELETAVTAMSRDDRHPLVSALLDSIKRSEETLLFPAVLGTSEAQVVMSMAEQKGLLVNFVGGTNNTISPDPAVNGYARLAISNPAVAMSDESEQPRAQTSGIESSEAKAVSDISLEQEDKINSMKSSTKKRSVKKSKPVKTVRFERCSIARDNKGGTLGLGDKVQCNVIQSRRTGAYLAMNVKIIERKMVERNVQNSIGADINLAGNTGTGLITEVVPARDFGFITQIDEHGLKKEVLFFHMSSLNLQNNDEQVTSETREKSGRSWRGRHNGHPLVRKGDEVQFSIGKNDKNGKTIALNISVLPHGTLDIPSKAAKNACEGIVLMEPSHTTLSNTPVHATTMSANQGKSIGGRWADVPDMKGKKESGSQMSEEGFILLLSDPVDQFNQRSKKVKSAKPQAVSSTSAHSSVKDEAKYASNVSNNEEIVSSGVSIQSNQSSPFIHVKYRSVGVAIRGTGSTSSVDSGEVPRRGDLVSFVKGKGSNMSKDIRVISRSIATTLNGHLENIVVSDSKATFVADNEKKDKYPIDLKEILSCNVKYLNESTKVEGILHEGSIYGVCRTTDLYLSSKIKIGMKERPRLNLSVKKELQGMGGKIVAQSGLAKGPDGTQGFVEGWTTRVSKFDGSKEQEKKDTEIGEKSGSEDEV